MHTFTYHKTLLHTLLLLVFKIVEGLQCILKAPLIPVMLLFFPSSGSKSLKTGY